MPALYGGPSHASSHAEGDSKRVADKHAGQTQCPRQDSNLRHLFRREVLYPLSYGGAAPSVANARATPTDMGSSAESPVIPGIADTRRDGRPVLVSRHDAVSSGLSASATVAR